MRNSLGGTVVSDQPSILQVVEGVVEDDVCVGPAEAERVHRDTTQTRAWPRDVGRWYADIVKIDIDVGVDLLEIRVGRNDALLEDDFDTETSVAGRGFLR